MVGVTLGSSFTDVVTAIRFGDTGAFTALHAAFQPGLGRYLRFRAPEAASELGQRIWCSVLSQIPNFAGAEKDFRVLLYTVTQRHLAEAGVAPHPERCEPWTLSANGVDQAVALLGNSLPPEQGQVVVLRVVADLDVEESAHVLRTTTGAVRLAQYKALVTLTCQFSNRRALPPSDETLSSFLDVSDPMPNLVFQGALPTWQARGALAPVARLVATARRRPTDEERAVDPEVLEAVRALAPGTTQAFDRRAKWTWSPGDRRARPRHLVDADGRLRS
jgi:RNA polymerase sigma-70 factor (ECF subfamily)